MDDVKILDVLLKFKERIEQGVVAHNCLFDRLGVLEKAVAEMKDREKPQTERIDSIDDFVMECVMLDDFAKLEKKVEQLGAALKQKSAPVPQPTTTSAPTPAPVQKQETEEISI